MVSWVASASSKRSRSAPRSASIRVVGWWTNAKAVVSSTTPADSRTQPGHGSSAPDSDCSARRAHSATFQVCSFAVAGYTPTNPDRDRLAMRRLSSEVPTTCPWASSMTNSG